MNTLRSFIIFTVLILLMGTASAATPPTVYVDTDGSGDYDCDGTDDHVQINQALAFVGSNAGYYTVHLNGTNTYWINLTLDMYSNTTLQGDTDAEIKLVDNAGLGYLVPMIGNETSGSINFTIKNFTIDGNSENQSVSRGTGYHTMMYFKNCYNITVTDMRLEWGSDDGLQVEHTSGAQDSAYVTFTNNFVYKLGHDALYVMRLNNVIAADNDVFTRTNSAFRLSGSNTAEIYNNTIHSEFAGWSTGPGIEIDSGYTIDNIEIYNNTIYNLNGAGIWLRGNTVAIGTDIHIHHNILYDVGQYWSDSGYSNSGIVIGQFNNTTIENNVIDDGGHAGIKHYVFGSVVDGTFTTVVRNNIIINADGQTTSPTGPGAGIWNYNDTNHNFISDNNCFYNNTELYNGTNITYSNDIYVNPLFYNESDNDYHLNSTVGTWNGTDWEVMSANSPCIDAGYSTSDYSDEPIPNSGIINIGRYGGTAYASKSVPVVTFISPTLSNGSGTVENYVEVNASINTNNLTDFIWNWNGTNYTQYNSSTVLYISFDNNSAIGDSSTVVVDVSSQGNNGSFINGTYGNWTTAGDLNGAMSFDGDDDNISLPMINISGAFTLSLWMYPTEDNLEFQGVFGSGQAFDDNVRYLILYRDMKIRGQVGNGTIVENVDYTIPSLNTWYFVQLVWDGTTGADSVKLYVNKILRASDVAGFSSIDTYRDWYVGRDTHGTDRHFAGMVDEARVDLYEWNQEQINQSYDSNLYKYNSTYWYFWSNQTDILEGEYNYQIFANNVESDYRIYTYDATIEPTYNNSGHNTTEAGASILFLVQYDDDIALHPNGQYIFSTNNTGIWVNDSAVNWTATPEYANKTKTLNSTHGMVVGYRWYADDNAGNSNNTPIYTLIVQDTIAPAVITSLTNATGNFYHNWTWTNPVDADFNYTSIYINGSWFVNTSNEYYNLSADAHNESTISTHTVDTTGNENSTWVNHTSIISNNAITMSDISASYSINEGDTLSIDANYTDADGDTGTFADNSSDWNVGYSTGIVSWVTVDGDDGVYNWYINVTDNNGSVSTQAFTVTVNDSIFPPTVVLISQTPSTICQNCTGDVNIVYGVTTDSSGLNNTSVSFIYRNYDPLCGCSNHSIRPPTNNLATEWDVDGRILRAANRNETLNFENNVTITGGDTFSWSGLDENSSRLSIEVVNSTYFRVYINGTVHDIMPQMWYLDRSDLQEAAKTTVSIYKNHNILVKFWGFEIFKGNTDFLGVGYTDTVLNNNPTLHPSDANPVSVYYLNSSYNPATGGDPLTSGYAVYMLSLNASEWVDHVYEPHVNSSYVRGFINNTILEQYIDTTNISYLLYVSETPPSKAFQINVTNVASSTNVSFANTNVLWTGDTTYTSEPYTPNIWFAFMKEGITFDHKLYVADNSDVWANSTLNSTVVGVGLFPPTKPTFYAFHNGALDFDMNDTYYGVIQVQVSASSDPDGGVVTHNLTLHYGANDTYIATINGSAVAEDGVYTNISFDTTPYYSDTLNYTLKIAATDDEGETATVWLDVNFSLGLHVSGTVYGGENIGLPDVSMTLGTYSTTTASDGTFLFTGISDGSHTLTSYIDGYDTLSKTVNVSGADVTGQDLYYDIIVSTGGGSGGDGIVRLINITGLDGEVIGKAIAVGRPDRAWFTIDIDSIYRLLSGIDAKNTWGIIAILSIMSILAGAFDTSKTARPELLLILGFVGMGIYAIYQSKVSVVFGLG